MFSSAPILEDKLSVDERKILSFESTVKLKDFCPERIKKIVPELSSTINNLISLVKKKNYITIDVMKHNFIARGKTCTDISYHVDGVDNEYIIWSIGDFRTEFLVDPILIPGLGKLSPRELAKPIFELTKKNNLHFMEAPSSVPIKYDSYCIHRGRIAEAGHKRVMIRVCSSDYIKPKNAVIT